MEPKETGEGACIPGFSSAGLREKKYGVALIVADKVCDSVGVFTKNSVKAAPVVLTKKLVKNGLKAVVVNSGCANACTPTGFSDAEAMGRAAAESLGVDPDNVGVASTGLIGSRLDVKLVERLVKKVSKRLGCSPKKSLKAAEAIMTTDTRPKQASYEYKGIKVGGICKGSGMIAPNMATMLCFLTTNAALSGKQLQSCLKEAADESFNQVVVDGDTSTNDMVLLLSSGTKKCGAADFMKVLSATTQKLAKEIAADGEGATKSIEVLIRGAPDKKKARAAARAVVSSPLVKAAVYGENPNWGRIAGKLGSVLAYDFSKCGIILESERGKACVVKKGVGRKLSKAEKIIKGGDIKITVNLAAGKEKATAWGCDLTPDYVRINAEYN